MSEDNEVTFRAAVVSTPNAFYDVAYTCMYECIAHGARAIISHLRGHLGFMASSPEKKHEFRAGIVFCP